MSKPTDPELPPAGLICIEGPDGAGKTFLADKLQLMHASAWPEAPEPLVIHCHRNDDSPTRPDNERLMMTYHDAVLLQAMDALADGRTVVLDRHWPSHYVYGAATMEPKASLERLALMADYRRHYEQPLTHLGPLYVMALDPQCLANSAEAPDPDHPWKPAQAQRVYDRYAALLADWQRVPPLCSSVRYDYRTHAATAEEFRKCAMRILEVAQNVARQSLRRNAKWHGAVRTMADLHDVGLYGRDAVLERNKRQARLQQA